MKNEEVLKELEACIGEYLKAFDLELVELIYRYEGAGLVLRVLVDKPAGGISLDECAGLNSRIGALLDEKDIIPGRYTLEVASPGLDRPMKTKHDFLRSLNRRARFFLREPVSERIELEGLITQVTDNGVEIEKDGEKVVIEFSKLNKAKQIIE